MGVAHADGGADARRDDFERTAKDLLSKVYSLQRLGLHSRALVSPPTRELPLNL